MDACRGCGGTVTSAESLLSEATLQEVLKSVAVALPVLSPLQEPDVSSDEDDVDYFLFFPFRGSCFDSECDKFFLPN